MAHFQDWLEYGDEYYVRFTRQQREQMVADRLIADPLWDSLTEAEQNFTIEYPTSSAVLDKK